MKNRFKILIIIVISLFFSALITLSASLHTLIHASDKIQYNEEAIGAIIETGGKTTVVLSDQDTNSFGRYVGRLVVKLSGQTEKPLRIRATVWTHEPGQKEAVLQSSELTDVNPIYVTTEILKIDRKNVVSIDLESIGGDGLHFDEIRIDNSFHFFTYLFAASFVILLITITLVVSAVDAIRQKIKIDWKKLCTSAFVILGLSTGILLCFCLPQNKVGYDEETHLQAVLTLASFPSNELHISEVLMRQLTVTEYNNPEAQPGGAGEQTEFSTYLDKYSDYKNGERNPDFSVPKNRIPAYLSMAVFCKAGKGLGLGWSNILILIRLANLFTYAALVYAALKLTPCGHALMLLIGLLPESLFMASTVSYDPFITGMLLLAMAFFLRLMEEKPQDPHAFGRDFAGFVITLLLGCMVKAVYAPLLLAAVLVPLRKGFGGKKKLLTILIALAAFACLVALFIVPTLLAPSLEGDIRGGEVSESRQLAFILTQPLTYASILLSQMIRWIPQTLLGPDCTTFMGHLVNGNTAYKGSWVLILVLILALAAAGNVSIIRKKTVAFLNPGERIWLLLVCFASAALIWTAMYLTFTVPGATEIAGVQGRYFIPLLFPVYFAFGAQEPAALAQGKEEVKADEKADSKANAITDEKADGKADGKAVRAKLAELVRNECVWYYLLMLGLDAALFSQLLRAVIFPYCM